MNLALVDNQLATVQPILTPDVTYALTTDGERLQLLANGVPVESGVTFFCMTNPRPIKFNARTGEYSIRHRTVFRAIFAGQHIDLEIKP